MRVVNDDTVVETALDSEYEACYLRLDELRWYSTANATRLQEIRHYGRPDEQELPPNQGGGSSGASTALPGSRRETVASILNWGRLPSASTSQSPFAGWSIRLCARVSRNTMLVSLQQMEDAVHSTAGTANRTAKSSTIAAGNAEGMVASVSKIANRFASRPKP